MAISETHYKLLRELKQRGVLPQGGSILEIGQANFYGDMDPREMLPDLPKDSEHARLIDCAINGGMVKSLALFNLAKTVYAATMAPTRRVSIDADPAAPGALKYDLNTFEILTEDGRGTFDTVINHGTAEHIFNIANVFRLMHDACKPGGLMIHESPFTGWVDHGFYCLQPTLFYDVAHANGYEMVMVALEHLASKTIIHIDRREHIHHLAKADQLPSNAMLFVVMRKVKEGLFKVPIQGVYRGVSAEAAESWMELR